MAFTKLVKLSFGSGTMSNDLVSFTLNGVSIGSKFKRFLDKKCVDVFSDKDNKMIAFKPTEDKSSGFPINWKTGVRSYLGLSLGKRLDIKIPQKIKGEIIDELLVCKGVEFEEKNTSDENPQLEVSN